MTLCITLRLEQFPSTTCYFVCTRCNIRLANTNKCTRQYYLWSPDIFDSRNTTLKLHVDVHHMTFADRSNMSTCSIALLIVVLINYCDNLLLREVEDI